MNEFLHNLAPETIEYIGYLGTAFVTFSFAFSNIRTLRIVNSIGAIIFIVYGMLLHMAKPIILTNLIIFAINAYHLSKGLFKQK